MPDLSVVVPVHNESGNVVPLLSEIVTALRGKADFEIVYIDDCSKDDTLNVLKNAKAQFPELRVVRHLVHVEGVVPAAVVDVDDFEIGLAAQGRHDFRQQGDDVAALVVHGHDNG